MHTRPLRLLPCFSFVLVTLAATAARQVEQAAHQADEQARRIAELEGEIARLKRAQEP